MIRDKSFYLLSETNEGSSPFKNHTNDKLYCFLKRSGLLHFYPVVKRYKITDPVQLSRFNFDDLARFGMTVREINHLVDHLIDDGLPVGNLLSDTSSDLFTVWSDLDLYPYRERCRWKVLRKLFGRRSVNHTSAPVSPAHRIEYRSMDRFPSMRSIDDDENSNYNQNVTSKWKASTESTIKHRSTSFIVQSAFERKSGQGHQIPRSHNDEQQQIKFTCLIPENDIKLYSLIGNGSFGIVRRGDWIMPSGKTIPVAVKLLRPDSMKQDLFTEFLHEVRAMQSLSHPNLLRLYGVVVSNPIMMVTELAPLGSLLLHLRAQSIYARNYYAGTTMRSSPLSAAAAAGNLNSNLPVVSRVLQVDALWDIGVQITSAMAYLTSQNLVHRDLAARNILLSSIQRTTEFPLIKIADFGLVRRVTIAKDKIIDDIDVSRTDVKHNSSKLITPIYTGCLEQKIPFAWSAPECLRSLTFSQASDVWSLGVTLWEIWTGGAAPWPDMDATTLLNTLDSGKRLVWPRTLCPRRLYQLMLACWRYEPHRRPTFTYLTERLDKIRPIIVIANQNLDEADRLGLESGDTIVVIDGRPKQFWWCGQNRRTGEVGLFPQAIVRSVNENVSGVSTTITACDTPHFPKSDKMAFTTNNTTTHSFVRSHSQNQPINRPVSSTSGLVCISIESELDPITMNGTHDLEIDSNSSYTYLVPEQFCSNVAPPILDSYDVSDADLSDHNVINHIASKLLADSADQSEVDERILLDSCPLAVIGLVKILDFESNPVEHKSDVCRAKSINQLINRDLDNQSCVLPPPPGPDEFLLSPSPLQTNLIDIDVSLPCKFNPYFTSSNPVSHTKSDSTSCFDQFSDSGEHLEPSAPPLIDLYTSLASDPISKLFTPRYHITIPSAPIYTAHTFAPHTATLLPNVTDQCNSLYSIPAVAAHTPPFVYPAFCPQNPFFFHSPFNNYSPRLNNNVSTPLTVTHKTIATNVFNTSSNNFVPKNPPTTTHCRHTDDSDKNLDATYSWYDQPTKHASTPAVDDPFHWDLMKCLLTPKSVAAAIPTMLSVSDTSSSCVSMNHLNTKSFLHCPSIAEPFSSAHSLRLESEQLVGSVAACNPFIPSSTDNADVCTQLAQTFETNPFSRTTVSDSVINDFQCNPFCSFSEYSLDTLNEISFICTQLRDSTPTEAHWALLTVRNPFSPLIPQLVIPAVVETTKHMDEPLKESVHLAIRLLLAYRLYRLNLVSWDLCCQTLTNFNWKLDLAADWLLDYMTLAV